MVRFAGHHALPPHHRTHLGRQLLGRLQHQRARAAADVALQEQNERQCKGGRLAAPRRRDAEDIPASEHRRQRLHLDRCRLRVAGRLDRPEEGAARRGVAGERGTGVAPAAPRRSDGRERVPGKHLRARIKRRPEPGDVGARDLDVQAMLEGAPLLLLRIEVYRLRRASRGCGDPRRSGDGRGGSRCPPKERNPGLLGGFRQGGRIRRRLPCSRWNYARRCRLLGRDPGAVLVQEVQRIRLARELRTGRERLEEVHFHKPRAYNNAVVHGNLRTA